ncbi:MAG: energy transducer TonB [Terracidiphilus sp.]
MVPPEEIEKAQPATLPADFSEWDSGEGPAAQQARQAAARAAVPPVVDRPHNARSSRPAAAYEDVEKLFQPRKSEGVKVAVAKPKAEREEVVKDKPKRTVIFAAIGSVAVLLIAGGLGYSRLRLAPAVPKTPVVAAQPATTSVVLPEPKSLPSVPTVAAPAAPTPDQRLRSRSDVMNSQLSAPSRISVDLKMLAGKEPPPSSGFGTGSEGLGGEGGSVFSGHNGPNVKIAAPRVMNISAGVAGGLLIQKTAPVYPQIAKEARVSGTVVIQATISKSGLIENLHVVNGPTMLRQPALDAVRTWRYRPYMLDGEPVEVETTVSVTFTLGG